MMKRIIQFLVISVLTFLTAVIYGWLTKPAERLKQLDSLDLKKFPIALEEMKKHRVIIAGITRNGFKEIPTLRQYIEYTGDLFADYKVIIFENDSNDGTKWLLEKWSKSNSKIHIISQNFHNQKRPSLQFLADARNHYLQAISSNPRYEGFDILMVVDLDMDYGWDMRGILDSFYRIDQWDAVCANGIDTKDGRMYDALAFRSEEFPYVPEKTINYWDEIMPKIKRIYPVSSPLVPVQSCFGGLAFYKQKFIKDCRYNSVGNDCEHVAFHECLRKNGARMFLNPSQLIRYSHFELSYIEKKLYKITYKIYLLLDILFDKKLKTEF